MSAQPDPTPSKHEIDLHKLEGAIADAQGDAGLLDLALDSMGQGDAWALFGRAPWEGYKLFLLANDQLRALHQANRRVQQSVHEAAVEFFGRALAKAA